MKSRLLGAVCACLSIVFCTNVSAATMELINNGGFETGDFAGWDETVRGIGGCDTDWNVSAVGGSTATGCAGGGNFGLTEPGAPIEGLFAAYNSFDGNGPQTFQLTQSILVTGSITTAQLSWKDTASWNMTDFGSVATQDRVFSVDIFDSSGTVLLGNIFSLNLIAQSTGSYDWTLRNNDILPVLSGHAGEVLTLSFSGIIPENFTGPAGFGLDAVSLQVTSVPVPAAVWLFGSGLIGLIGLAKRKKV